MQVLVVLAALAVSITATVPKLTVLVVEDEPHVIQSSNGTLSGYVIDVLDALAPLVGFTYTIAIQPDGYYGSPQADGTWNGVVGSLINKKADIGGQLIISPDREKVVDFTTPIFQSTFRVLTNVQTGTNNVKYLILKNVAPLEIALQTSTDPQVKAIWANIQQNNGFVDSVHEGIQKVMSGGFAFIESANTLGHHSRKNSGKLRFSNNILFTQQHAVAVQKGSPLRDKLSAAIAQLKKQGKFKELLTKWNME